ELWQTVLSSVPKKEAEARAQTVQTLLERGRIDAPEVKAQIGGLVAAAFLDLDNRSQIDDLRRNWDLLRMPAIVAALRTVATLPASNDGALGPYSRDGLKAVAFPGWPELDPDGARLATLAPI